MKRIGYRRQRTLAKSVSVSGVGYLTGHLVRLRFRPAAVHTGVVFQRVDLPNAPAIPARVDRVSGSNRRTTLGNAPGQVDLVEHVLAALAGLRIDNCLVELDRMETPAMDGSALGFAEALIADGGAVVQDALRPIYVPTFPVTVREGDACLTFYPDSSEHLRLTYLLDYGASAPLPPQRHTQELLPGSFLSDLAPCRTFVLESEVEALRQQGIGKHATTKDLLVFGRRGPIDNPLRFANEPARHKTLDMVGDFALFEGDLRGHIVGCRSGHYLNASLVLELNRILARQQNNLAPVRRAA